MPAGVGYGNNQDDKSKANVPVPSQFTSPAPILGKGFSFRNKKKKAKPNSIESLAESANPQRRLQVIRKKADIKLPEQRQIKQIKRRVQESKIR